MRQILILDSLEDQRFRTFFEKVFFSVGVGTVWKNYEGIGTGNRAWAEMNKEVGSSDALFLILSGEVQRLSGAPDWVFGEPGFAAGKDVWVFEHCEDLMRLSIRTPALRNYVAFYITNAWTDYIVKIAEGFEENPAPRPPLPEAKLGPLPAPGAGSFFEASTGLALYDFSTSRPTGFKTACPHCSGSYAVHLPSDMEVLRCPACGSFFEIKPASRTPVPAAV